MIWLCFVCSPFEVHDFRICVCNNMYEHVFGMYAMVCMDVNFIYLFLLQRNIDYNKLHWHENLMY